MILSSSSGTKIIYPDQKLEPISTFKKLKGASRTFLISGGLTVLSIAIPVLHFVLVPLGILITGVITYFALRKNYQLDNFEVHCPNCDQKSATTVAGASLPLRTFCGHCRHMIYLNN